jgi:hypothetical protein
MPQCGVGERSFMNAQERKNLVDLCCVHTQGTPAQRSAQRRQIEALADSQLIEIAAEIRRNVAQEDARRAAVKLVLVQQGLESAPVGKDSTGRVIEHRNWQIINQRLPGDSLTVEAFRKLLDSDPSFKKSLVFWKEPFTDLAREEQEQLADEQKRRREFSAIVKALFASGTADIADHDGNYRLCVDQLEDLLVSGSVGGTFIAALASAIARGLIVGLAPNQQEDLRELEQQVRQQLLVKIQGRLDNPYDPNDALVRRKLQQDSFREINERIDLCGQLADNYSPSISNNNQHFRSLFVANTSNVQYSQDVAAMLERKKFAAMTPQQIRDYDRHQQTPPQPKQLSQAEAIRLEAEQSGLPPLPEKDGNGVVIDAAYINRVSLKDTHLFRAWIQRFGRANVVGRMMGVR